MEILNQLNVLYIEDDEMIREQMKLFLRKKVNKLLVAENGLKGLEIFRDKSIDCIVTDLKMPVMDGIEFCKNIRQSNKSCPIIITTAFSDVETIIGAVDLNIDKYLLKPIKGKDLVKAIEEVYDVAVRRSQSKVAHKTGMDISKEDRKTIEKNLQIKISQFIKVHTGKGPRSVVAILTGDSIVITLSDPFTIFQKTLLKNKANRNMVKYMRETFYNDFKSSIQTDISKEANCYIDSTIVTVDIEKDKEEIKFKIRL